MLILPTAESPSEKLPTVGILDLGAILGSHTGTRLFVGALGRMETDEELMRLLGRYIKFNCFTYIHFCGPPPYFSRILEPFQELTSEQNQELATFPKHRRWLAAKLCRARDLSHPSNCCGTVNPPFSQNRLSFLRGSGRDRIAINLKCCG